MLWINFKEMEEQIGEKIQEQNKKEETASHRINRIITTVCAFLIVIFVNDIRSKFNDIQKSMESTSTLYSSLNTRVTLLEYIVKPENTLIKLPSNNPSKNTDKEQLSSLFIKPENDYSINGNKK